ncbi:MAG: IS1595 family transposase, partial [Winogradskyella sp.]|nr:IS1595 family transposase [Winogradskyella sp.]MBT8244169.1 IS1595 family transposase [Winogradskyella sp.]NNK22342.1 IS1595 family transposase [Winogradskyella sp.]NNK23172.1 IS1595 family transposase [Winogradskyella sp.]
FCFRINRSQFKTSIFHKTITRMVESKPIYQNQLKQKLNV